MQHLVLFEKFKEVDLESSIMHLHKIPKELKEEALKLLRYYNFDGKKVAATRAKNGVITELELHPDLVKKIKEHDYPNGFSMGIDKNGYFIHTHRARGKSHKTPIGITAKEIKFIDSTG